MAWSMQPHMIQYIKPSIDRYADEHEVLVELYVDTVMDLLPGPSGHPSFLATVNACWNLSRKEMIDAIAEAAEAYSTTTNGGFFFYVDEHTTIPWCSEDVFLAWNG